MLEESLFVDIDAFEPARIKDKLHTFTEIKDKITYLQYVLERVIFELNKVAKQIEEYDRNPIADDDKATRFVSMTNYKLLMLRNSKFFLLEELVQCQSEYITLLTNK